MRNTGDATAGLLQPVQAQMYFKRFILGRDRGPSDGSGYKVPGTGAGMAQARRATGARAKPAHRRVALQRVQRCTPLSDASSNQRDKQPDSINPARFNQIQPRFKSRPDSATNARFSTPPLALWPVY